MVYATLITVQNYSLISSSCKQKRYYVRFVIAKNATLPRAHVTRTNMNLFGISTLSMELNVGSNDGYLREKGAKNNRQYKMFLFMYFTIN